jgi:hypothetical protein
VSAINMHMGYGIHYKLHKAVTWNLSVIINTTSQFQPVISNSEQKATSSGSVKLWPCSSLNIKRLEYLYCKSLLPTGFFSLPLKYNRKGLATSWYKSAQKLSYFTHVKTILTKNIMYTPVSHAAILITGHCA